MHSINLKFLDRGNTRQTYNGNASKSLDFSHKTMYVFEHIVSQTRPRDCSEVLKHGNKLSGVYTIWPMSNITQNKPLQVYCDMNVAGEGWTVSNDNIYALSNQGPCEIRFDLEDTEGNRRFAIYKKFWIDDEASFYTLHIGDYSGNAGNGMRFYNGRPFVTEDKDHHQMAQKLNGAWWMFEWPFCHLNGIYIPGVHDHRIGTNNMTDAPPNSKILDKVAAYKVKIMPSSSTLSKIVRDHAYCCGLICIMTFLVLLSGYYVTKETKTVCEERQKANILMQIAEDLYSKANGLDPKEDKYFKKQFKRYKYTDPTNSKFRVSGFGFSHNGQTDKTEDKGSKISFRDLEPVNIPSEVLKQSKKSKSRNSGKSESAKPADYNALPWKGAYTDPGDGPRDCSEILASGANTSGVYTIMPKSNTTNNRPLRVYCDMDTDGGGWTVSIMNTLHCLKFYSVSYLVYDALYS
ncbi:techylectin-5A [Caerostris extrusa]|uniref:Techylectin-5A n=1 Tax=Caerostris extrusa TaxID=172846 RepID=A0AAV4TNB4_CAEEX|nr:techylectin-5A [Caerostris extrusa]